MFVELSEKKGMVGREKTKPAVSLKQMQKSIIFLCAVFFFTISVFAVSDESIQKLKEKAQAGDAISQCKLGVHYECGKGVEKNYTEAAFWYRKSAEQGLAVSRAFLGKLYMNGRGVPKDYVEAVKWFRIAAEQGSDIGQENLGFCYHFGRGVPEDCEMAVKWYTKAAFQGNQMALRGLGLCYAGGQGVRKDLSEAYAYFNIAGIKDKSARESCDELENQMTKEQIAEGQIRTQELMKELKNKENQ